MPKILNHKCEKCGKEITIEEGTMIWGRPIHYKCYEVEDDEKEN